MRRRGQAAVETALVMPLVVFLVLGTLQLSLVHQARLMTKYAAYKAARAGSIGSAAWNDMDTAALAVLMPMASSGAAGIERVFPATTPTEWSRSWEKIKDNRQSPPIPYVVVQVCNPTLPRLRAQAAAAGIDLNKGVDFDDPRLLGDAWATYNVTRLQVQVTFYYRMPIPFANAMLWMMARGVEHDDAVRTLRMTPGTVRESLNPNGGKRTIEKVPIQERADAHEYILPIRASWGMRMQSKLWPDLEGFELPDTNLCSVPWKKEGS